MKIMYFVMASVLIGACNFGGKNGAKQSVQNSDKTDSVSSNNDTKEASMDDMVFLEGGEFTMGREDGMAEERPAHMVTIKPFYIDKYPVTVRQFRTFVKETGYITEAQKYTDSGVFDFANNAWNLLPGATWEFPLGPDKERAKNDHPVTHVSWRDAVAYAKWAGKRLPTEAEWEYAARDAGTNNSLYTWGNEPKLNGKWMTNVFQGTVDNMTVEDGYLMTSPVGAYAPSKLGLYDFCGNIWEWTADTYRPYGSSLNQPADENTKVTRGGSFMYDEAQEASFTVYFRSKNTVETSLFNTGFRCAKDVD